MAITKVDTPARPVSQRPIHDETKGAVQTAIPQAGLTQPAKTEVDAAATAGPLGLDRTNGVAFSPELRALNEQLRTAKDGLTLQQRDGQDGRALLARVDGLIATLGQPGCTAAPAFFAKELDPGLQFRSLSLTLPAAEFQAIVSAPDEELAKQSDGKALRFASGHAVTEELKTSVLASLSGGDGARASAHVLLLPQAAQRLISEGSALLAPVLSQYLAPVLKKSAGTDTASLSKTSKLSHSNLLKKTTETEQKEDGVELLGSANSAHGLGPITVPGPDVLAVEAALPRSSWLSDGLSSGADIDSLVTLMMMELEKDSTRDLRELVGEMKTINARKAKMRDDIAHVKQQQTKMSGELHTRYEERCALPESDSRHINKSEVSYENFEATQMTRILSGSLEDNDIDLAISPNEQYYPKKAPPASSPGSGAGAQPGATAETPPAPPEKAPYVSPASKPYNNGMNQGQAILYVADAKDIPHSANGDSTAENDRRAVVRDAWDRIPPEPTHQVKTGLQTITIPPKVMAADLTKRLLSAFAAMAIGKDWAVGPANAKQAMLSAKATIQDYLKTLPPEARLAVTNYIQLELVNAERDARVIGNFDQNSDVQKSSILAQISDGEDNLNTSWRTNDGELVVISRDMTDKWGELAEAIAVEMRAGFLTQEREAALKEAAVEPAAAPQAFVQASAGAGLAPGAAEPTARAKNKTAASHAVKTSQAKIQNAKPLSALQLTGAESMKVNVALTDQLKVKTYMDGHKAHVNVAELRMGSLKDHLEGLEGKKDSLSELSEEMSLRLQMYQQRRTKFIETLSNLLKKHSDTSSLISGNLK